MALVLNGKWCWAAWGPRGEKVRREERTGQDRTGPRAEKQLGRRWAHSWSQHPEATAAETGDGAGLGQILQGRASVAAGLERVCTRV